MDVKHILQRVWPSSSGTSPAPQSSSSSSTLVVDKSRRKEVERKARELIRLCSIRFDSSTFGVGEVAKSVLCVDLAALSLGVTVERATLIRLSGLPEKAYKKSLGAVQNALGIRPTVELRSLAIQFGCARVVEATRRNFEEFKARYLAALPEERRVAADFTRPAFVAAAFLLTARRNQLKVDREQLLDVVAVTEEDFANIASSMTDLCPDLFGASKRKEPSAAGQRPAAASKKRCISSANPDGVEQDSAAGTDGSLAVGNDNGESNSSRAVGEQHEEDAVGDDGDDYEKWKQSLMAAKAVLKEAVTHEGQDSGLKKELKQSRLSFGHKAKE